MWAITQPYAVEMGTSSAISPAFYTKMRYHFTQHEFEKAIAEPMSYGTHTELATRIGKSLAIISQMYNPDDERESNLYKAARELAAMMEMDAELGRRQIATFLHFVHRHAPATTAHNELDEVRKWLKERGEADIAMLEQMPLATQIKEIEDVYHQIERVLAAKRSRLQECEA